MELIGLQSIICRRNLRAIRLPTTPQRDLFPSRPAAYSHRPSPDSRESGSFSRVASPLRSSFADSPCGSFQSCRPARVPSLSAASPSVSTRRAGMPASATVRPQVFSTSRRLAPPIGFAGLLHPAATPRVASVQGLLSIQIRRWLVASACLHAVVGPSLTGIPAATSARLGFEALLPGSPRSSGSLFRLPCGRSPLRISPPAGSALPP